MTAIATPTPIPAEAPVLRPADGVGFGEAEEEQLLASKPVGG